MSYYPQCAHTHIWLCDSFTAIFHHRALQAKTVCPDCRDVVARRAPQAHLAIPGLPDLADSKVSVAHPALLVLVVNAVLPERAVSEVYLVPLDHLEQA